MIKYFWQLPQNIIALIIIYFTKAKFNGKEINGIKVYSKNFNFGVSLGNYIILGDLYLNDKTIKHEYGHCIQSMYFGWLYLLIIGIPSASMNLLTQWKILKSENYYKRWPENWADKLGNVNR